MARIYGISDSELSFISLLNSNLKEIKVKSFEEYQNYKGNNKEERKIIEEDYDNKIKAKFESITQKYNEIKQLEYELRKVEWSLRKKENIVGRYWGKVKNDIKNQISSLRNKRYNLNSEISELKNEVVGDQTKKDLLIKEKRETLSNFDKDIKTIFQLENNEEFRNKRQGAVGENKLIDYIDTTFQNENTFNLFNGLNFDIIGGAININNSTKTETQIDHVLVCPKGVYFIETKFWKIDGTEEFRRKLLEQLEKIKRTIIHVFNNKINEENVKVLLVGTERKIALGGSNFISLRLDELKDYLLNQKEALTKSEIILILNEFSKHLPKDKFHSFPRYKIGINSWFIKMRNKLKGK